MTDNQVEFTQLLAETQEASEKASSMYAEQERKDPPDGEYVLLVKDGEDAPLYRKYKNRAGVEHGGFRLCFDVIDAPAGVKEQFPKGFAKPFRANWIQESRSLKNLAAMLGGDSGSENWAAVATTVNAEAAGKLLSCTLVTRDAGERSFQHVKINDIVAE